MDKLTLEPTAALVMQWGKAAYKNETLSEFIQHLDLSSGNELFDQINSICDWYDEVILNRKYFITKYINDEIAKSKEDVLLLNLGAGKSPLSLEVLQNNFDKVDKILEVDIAGMDDKKELYDKFFPKFSDKIKCITADITSPAILTLLNGILHEYYNDLSCIIVLEGISYYLDKRELENIVTSFKSNKKNNYMVMEYLVPPEKISEINKDIPKKVFNTIQKYSGLNFISEYSIDNLKEIFNKYDGELKLLNNLREIEKLRKGDNKYFVNEDDGWIECSVWKI